MRKIFAILVSAGLAGVAIADYSFFISGYPPPAADHFSTTGDVARVTLGFKPPEPSTALALDSRYRTSGPSNTSPLNSKPPAIFIILR